jgi:hypothetical protein
VAIVTQEDRGLAMKWLGALGCGVLVAGALLTGQGVPTGPRSGVTPLPQRPRTGSVTPLETPENPAASRVFAIGTATVFNGNVRVARQAALQAAYAEAVAMGAGTEIGRMTLIKNVQAVSDVIASRSRGFVKSYEVIAEEVKTGEPPTFEIRIRAEVVRTANSPLDELEGLKLFLDVIGSPKLLVLLPEQAVQDPTIATSTASESTQVSVTAPGTSVSVTSQSASSTAAPPQPQEREGVMRSAEAAVAAAFVKYGYSVSTSDDLVSGGLASAAQLSRARQGVTADAVAVARAAGADLLLTGVLRTATQRVRPQGVEFVSATTEASAKALVVSNGYLIDAFHKTTTKAHVSALGAVSMSLDAIAADFAAALAWNIPKILTARPRVTRLVVSNVGLAAAERLRNSLQKVDGIDVVRFAAVPTATNRTAEFELLSGYVVLPQDELVNHCIETAGPVQVKAADKYTVSLALL